MTFSRFESSSYERGWAGLEERGLKSPRLFNAERNRQFVLHHFGKSADWIKKSASTSAALRNVVVRCVRPPGGAEQLATGGWLGLPLAAAKAIKM